MEFRTEITRITHDDLVNLFSTALYGDESFDVYVPNECKELKAPQEGDDTGACYEDNLARVLLHGGYIYVEDNETRTDEYETKEEAVANLEGDIHGDFPADDNWDAEVYFDEETGVAVVRYKITLERIKTALSTMCTFDSPKVVDSDDEDSRYLYENFQNLFINEEGDYWDAYNVLQFIIFNEVVYG